ncbi:glycosyltransferase family 4 protein [bacterium]|nr:glycosyltransferase family 4 protein [bacterium]
MTGSAISLRNLLMALDNKKFVPRILLGSNGPAQIMFESLGIPVDVVFMRKFATFPGPHWFQRNFLRGFLSFAPNRQLSAYLRKHRPDLVHINDKSLLGPGIAASRCGCPVVWHLRSTYAVTHSRLNATVSRAVIRCFADRLIAISEDETDGFEDMGKLAVIHNSVNLKDARLAAGRRGAVRSELGIAENEVAVGMIGQLNQYRGAWDFIRMAGLAFQEEKSLRFIVMGSVPAGVPIGSATSLGRGSHGFSLERQISKMIDQAGISNRLILTGFRDDALAVIAGLDILVVCNRLGVLGRPPFEAMAVGRPVVAYAGDSGRSSVMKDRVTGFIVPAGDLQALASAVVKLARNPDLRRRMGVAGQRHARKNFNPDHNARAVERLYAEILCRAGKGKTAQ